jgi:glutathione S-transferase
MGQLPTLELADVRISQSLAIIRYIESAYPSPSMTPSGLVLSTQMWGICEIINSYIQPVQRGNFADKLENLREDKAKWWQFVFDNGFRSIEAIVKKTSGLYCIADQVTIADAVLYPQVYNAYRFV